MTGNILQPIIAKTAKGVHKPLSHLKLTIAMFLKHQYQLLIYF